MQPLLAQGARNSLERIVERFGNRERLADVAIYDPQGRPVLMTPNLAARLGPKPPALDDTVCQGNGWGKFFSSIQGETHLYAVPVRSNGAVIGALAVFHDASYISAQNAAMWRDTFNHILVQMLLIAAITLLIVRWSMERPISRMVQWLHDLRAGTELPNPDLPGEHVLKPLTRQVTHLAVSLRTARASAEEEARLRDTADSLWTTERLRVSQQDALQNSPLFVVSNREPYEHVHRGGSVGRGSVGSGLP